MQLGFQSSAISFQTLFLIVCATFLYMGCEPSFDPIKQNDRHFSVFGYLNASADTQYVRIEKLRDGMAADTPLDLEAKVTLTNVTSNQTVTLQDSVYEYYLQGKAHNFYTTMEISPNQKYRLEVNGEEGNSSAELEIPDAFPKPEVLDTSKFQTILKVKGIKRLVGIKTIYQTCQNCSCDETIRYTYSNLKDTLYMDDGSVKAEIDLLEEKKKIFLNYPENKDYSILRYDVVVAAGMPSWPNYADLDPEEVILPDVATNVNNGVGYLGGIVTDTLNVIDSCTRVATDSF